MKKSISEFGRSMVEILGVLAIMGILTIASLWAYRYSLDLIMANSIIRGVRARSIIVGQQRVLRLDLNLQEFHPDSEEDLIYDRFKVVAFNDYETECDDSDRQFPEQAGRCANVVANCNMPPDEPVQAMEVYNIPYRVCEALKDSQFVDPTCNAINGQVYQVNFNGEMIRSGDVVCIPDVEQESNEGQIKGALYGVYHNVATFVFRNGLGNPCNGPSDCLTGCCIEHICHESADCPCGPCQVENSEGNCVPDANGTACMGPDSGVEYCCKAGSCVVCDCEAVGGRLMTQYRDANGCCVSGECCTRTRTGQRNASCPEPCTDLATCHSSSSSSGGPGSSSSSSGGSDSSSSSSGGGGGNPCGAGSACMGSCPHHGELKTLQEGVDYICCPMDNGDSTSVPTGQGAVRDPCTGDLDCSDKATTGVVESPFGGYEGLNPEVGAGCCKSSTAEAGEQGCPCECENGCECHQGFFECK